MKLIRFSLITVFIVSAAFLLTSSIDNFIFKVNKSFDIFGSVFKYISNNYVDEIDPDELMKYGIDGILENLDPYTVYYDESETEDIDMLTSGAYTGLGISVAVKDSLLTIMGVRQGFPAQKSGIRIGDRLYKIDSVVTLYKTPRDLRYFTKGEPGSKCTFWILRDGLKDTLRYDLVREQIQIRNVSYSGFIDEGIGYIKLERFSRNSAKEVRMALNSLKMKDSLDGLVLDLRDNPGGLLDAAVSICELFVPQGSVIVTTKGRKSNEEYTYRSYQQPMEPDLPLAVLINENSASASEIVAGAMQDLDRAVIIGRRSYGKGLVQSVFDVPYKGSLKITTAKYYTPSGRCIQKLELIKNRYKDGQLPQLPDTSIFYTSNKRIVTENVGIKPDTIIATEQYPGYVNELINSNQIFNFANYYSSKFENLPQGIHSEQGIINEFGKFLQTRKYAYKSELAQMLERYAQAKPSDSLTQSGYKQVVELARTLDRDEKEYLKKYSKTIYKLDRKSVV